MKIIVKNQVAQDGKPCPGIPDGEHEASIQWQFYNPYGEYWTNCSQRTAELYCSGKNTRQIYVIINK